MVDVGAISSQRIAEPIQPGAWLRVVLDGRGITVSEAARMLRASRPTFAAILAGRKPFSMDFARRCGEAFGIDPYTLVRLQMEADYADASKTPVEAP
jgi:plasmid maintenance system antidote protein VapI